MQEPHDPRDRFTILAEYELYGENHDGTAMIDGESWMAEKLSDACRDGRLVDFGHIRTFAGFWGLQLVTFEVDILMMMQRDVKGVRKKARKKLNEIVGDSDVRVRWVTRHE